MGAWLKGDLAPLMRARSFSHRKSIESARAVPPAGAVAAPDQPRMPEPTALDGTDRLLTLLNLRRYGARMYLDGRAPVDVAGRRVLEGGDVVKIPVPLPPFPVSPCSRRQDPAVQHHSPSVDSDIGSTVSRRSRVRLRLKPREGEGLAPYCSLRELRDGAG